MSPARPPLDIRIGDVLELRKPHPCGDKHWSVVRVGADIGLRCHGCQHRIMLPRTQLERRVKTLVSRGSAPPGVASEPGDAMAAEHDQ